MNAADVTDGLFRYFNAYRGYSYQLVNAYVWDWESDFFCLSGSGYSYDIEVKVSRADYKADFNKTRRHRILGWPHETYVKRLNICQANLDRFTPKAWRDGAYYSSDGRIGWNPPASKIKTLPLGQVCPNKFLFAVPKGLIEPNEVPDYAGLIFVSTDRRRKPVIIKKPPALHNFKKDFTKLLLKKYYWAYLNSLGNVKHGKNFDFPDQNNMTRTR